MNGVLTNTARLSLHSMFATIFAEFDAQTGLTAACLNSPHTKEDVSHAVLQYVKKWIPFQRAGILAGSSVHFDKAFLAKEMPQLIDWLHYR
jgi:oligoribonuclease